MVQNLETPRLSRRVDNPAHLLTRKSGKYDIFIMASFYYNYQNPSGFSFLMLIRAFVLCCPLGLQNLHLKRKTK